MSKDKNLTKGNPFKLIFTFAVSMMMGNVFQQLYTTVDNIIIGRTIGAIGIAAIGGIDWLIFLVNGFLIGLIQGFSVILGKRFGEKNEKSFENYYKKSRWLCFIISVVLVILLLSSSELLLRLISTKEETFEYAKTYVNVIFAGIPFLVFYQFFAAVLRSRGNSRIHLMAMTVSSICNVILDLVFICVMKMGIAGAALGTVISECLVMIICGYHVFEIRKGTKHFSETSSSGGDFSEIWELLSVGLPMAFQSAITAIGGLIVIRCVNQYEISFLTGYSTAGKVYALLEVFASSYSMAVVAYVSQNYGAGRLDRIRSGVRISLLMGVITALMCSFIMIFFGVEAMGLFIDRASASAEIFGYGHDYLVVLAIFFPLLYALYIMRASLQGLGNTVIPMVSSMGQLVMRVSCALILTRLIGCSGIYYGEISAWILADIILVVTYFLEMGKLKNHAQNKAVNF